MNNILLFTFASDNILYGQPGMHTTNVDNAMIKKVRPLILVCQHGAASDYLLDEFFFQRPKRLYVNIDESGKVPVVDMFIQVLLEPEVVLHDRGKYLIHQIGDLVSFPGNNVVQRAMYGIAFPTSKKGVDEIKENFHLTSYFIATLGLKHTPGHMVLLPDEVEVAMTFVLSSQKSDEFRQHIFKLPQGPW